MVPVLDQIAADWRSGDVGAIEDLMLEGFVEFPDLYGRIVTERNRSWIDPIEDLLAGDRDAMVIVGSLHLVGDEGVVALLKEKGYRVVQK